MKCEAVQNRLLDVPDLTAVPAELSAHLDGCELCRRFAERAQVLNAELAALPVPSSELAKIAFVESLLAAGPVIRSVPTPMVAGLSLQDLLRKIPLRPVVTTAAAVLVGVGTWAVWPTSKTTTTAKDAPRHELLQKVVKTNTELALLTAPKDRVTKLASLAGDIRSETRALSKAAEYDEMLSLTKMYENVVTKGVLPQAEQMTKFNTPLPERQAALKAARAELSQTVTDVTDLVPLASPRVQPLLKRIAKAAQDGEARLVKLADGGA
ncbi:hypothetical protein [Limnoglobus roseus]|uniref:Zinc-finger domain-containing protein n=1 Tax=Limnoglobus roseus TaxID=2598579 RepID=A0A5C1AFK0_9BACT|nr:hypothetical protein [Limnoglobus roseus]QEL15924.1 hypothetical protein PX52LOC_02860 [Limnoglobus roseus]